MLAFQDTTVSKEAVMAQLRRHAAADVIVKGRYWSNGKGCAVGCTIHSGNHAEYETRFGIPQMLARLEDTIFEGLSNAEAKEWPLQFMTTVQPGADLSCVGWQFLHWLLTDEKISPGINHSLVRDVVKRCADVFAPLTKGELVDTSVAREVAVATRVAAIAARVAESAARAAREEEAESAARLAAWAAWTAQSVAWAAESESESMAAESARAAAQAAESAAAWSVPAQSAAHSVMAKKLLVLILNAPILDR